MWSVLAPLSKEKYGDLLGKLDLYHSGVVVENECVAFVDGHVACIRVTLLLSSPGLLE